MICSLRARSARQALLLLVYLKAASGISKSDDSLSGQILSDGQINHIPLLRREVPHQSISPPAQEAEATPAGRVDSLINEGEVSDEAVQLKGTPVWTLVNKDQDCQPSTDWIGKVGNDKCSTTCQSRGYSFFLNAPDNNCKCCSAGYKVEGGTQKRRFNVYQTAAYTLVNKHQDCQPSSDWIGKVGNDKCSTTCQSRGYSFFLNAPDNNCKCCSVGYKVNNDRNFNVYHVAPYTLVNKNQDCQPSTDWIGVVGMAACSTTCQSRGYSFFLNAPDNNCKCCSAGYKLNDAGNFNVYQSAVLTASALVNKDQDCQPSTDWFGAIGMEKCSTTCQGQGYSFFLNAPDNNCKCCLNGYKLNDAPNFNVYQIDWTFMKNAPTEMLTGRGKYKSSSWGLSHDAARKNCASDQGCNAYCWNPDDWTAYYPDALVKMEHVGTFGKGWQCYFRSISVGTTTVAVTKATTTAPTTTITKVTTTKRTTTTTTVTTTHPDWTFMENAPTELLTGRGKYKSSSWGLNHDAARKNCASDQGCNAYCWNPDDWTAYYPDALVKMEHVGTYGKGWQCYFRASSVGTTDACNALEKSIKNKGWTDSYRGWYDTKENGRCRDYCRWISGKQPGRAVDPKTATTQGPGSAFWSCALEGEADQFSASGAFGNNFKFQRCNGPSPCGATRCGMNREGRCWSVDLSMTIAEKNGALQVGCNLKALDKVSISLDATFPSPIGTYYKKLAGDQGSQPAAPQIQETPFSVCWGDQTGNWLSAKGKFQDLTWLNRLWIPLNDDSWGSFGFQSRNPKCPGKNVSVALAFRKCPTVTFALSFSPSAFLCNPPTNDKEFVISATDGFSFGMSLDRSFGESVTVFFGDGSKASRTEMNARLHFFTTAEVGLDPSKKFKNFPPGVIKGTHRGIHGISFDGDVAKLLESIVQNGASSIFDFGKSVHECVSGSTKQNLPRAAMDMITACGQGFTMISKAKGMITIDLGKITNNLLPSLEFTLKEEITITKTSKKDPNANGQDLARLEPGFYVYRPPSADDVITTFLMKYLPKYVKDGIPAFEKTEGGSGFYLTEAGAGFITTVSVRGVTSDLICNFKLSDKNLECGFQNTDVWGLKIPPW